MIDSTASKSGTGVVTMVLHDVSGSDRRAMANISSHFGQIAAPQFMVLIFEGG